MESSAHLDRDPPGYEETDFEAVPHDPACFFCRENNERPLAGVDAIYCIAVREQPMRAAAAVAHLHETGLCRGALMYRPRQGKDIERAIWRSHAILARRALAHGQKRILALEDDFHMSAPSPALREGIAKAIAALPDGWWCLYLGHLAKHAYRFAPGVLRVQSLTTHAFIANEPMLRWLTRVEAMDPTLPFRWGDSIDTAMACLPDMYAVTPMLAFQRRIGEMRADSEKVLRRRISILALRIRMTQFSVYTLLGPLEWFARLCGPIHRHTLERVRARPGRSQYEALLLRESGLFDEAFYRAKYPDIVRGDVNPLSHYLKKGIAEGRWPNALFDPQFYLAGQPALRGRTIGPAVHYLTHGAREGRNPHPLFDSTWYLEHNRDVARAGLNPLAHFLRMGWREGRDPSPQFSNAQYRAERSAAMGAPEAQAAAQ